MALIRIHKNISRLALACFAATLLAACDVGPKEQEYILTAAKPDQIYAIDADEGKVMRTYTVANAGGSVYSFTPNSDGSRIYALVNKMRSITGIDVDSGEEVFRADFPAEGIGSIQHQGFFAMDISPDGNEIFAYRMRTRIHPSEYEVLQPEIAVFSTADGLDAEPVRVLEAPRRIHLLMMARDGKSIYAMGFDIFRMDAQTGEVLETIPLRNWTREHASIPDILDFWPLWEQSGIFSTPVYYVNTAAPLDSPEAYKTGLLRLDLKTGEHNIRDIENTSVLMFSSVINPKDHDKAYAVYTQLSKVDLAGVGVTERIDLDHTYYAINISSDGSELYVGGAACDVAIYDSETLEKKKRIFLPDPCGDQGVSSLRMMRRNTAIPN